MAVCISIIGKDNSPLFIWVDNEREELQLQFLAHTGLDVIQEKASVGSNITDSGELYLGMLYASEEYKIFGYATNTGTKFVIITDATNATLRDNEIRSMFRNLHNLYASWVCNPFYIPGDTITSKKFKSNVVNLILGQ